jgi:ELWxxDGT repeat protein
MMSMRFALIMFVLSSVSFIFGAESVVLVKDLGAFGSAPNYLTVLNSDLIFVADDGVNGFELWKTDGTDAGTVLLKDIRPGSSSSGILEVTAVGSTVFFRANDGVSGDELWKTDGTAAGTVMVKDIRPGASGSTLGVFHNYNGTLLFSASDGTNGTELWKSDGTAAGTVMLEIDPGSGSSSPIGFVNFNGKAYFAATTFTGGRELWSTDGTQAGTTAVVDIAAGSASGLSLSPGAAVSNGMLFFAAAGTGFGVELWKSDGTGGGTSQVLDIVTGSSGSSPDTLIDLNGVLLFTAQDPTNGRALWKSDGTAGGTSLVSDISPDLNNPVIAEIVVADGVAYFRAFNVALGTELWRSNGTPAGTFNVKDIYPGGNSANVSSIAAINGTIYFTANDGVVGVEPWKSDGTAAGTVRIQDVKPGIGDGTSSPAHYTLLGTTIFLAADAGSGTELFKFQNTAAPGSPAITSATAASGITDVPFSYTITASNTPTSFEATGLPSGLSVNTTTGAISGTPTAPGVSSVTISATNASGTGSAMLTITITSSDGGGSGSLSDVDSDGDGYSDEFESILGTSPTSAVSTPLNARAGNPLTLIVSKLQIKLNFARSESDTLMFAGTVPVPDGFTVLNASIAINVGGVIVAATLDEKGVAKDSHNMVKIRVKAKKGIVAAQTSPISLKVNRSVLATLLTDEGLTDSTLKDVNRTIPISVIFNGELYKASVLQLYTAKVDKNGRTKTPR